MGWLSSMGQHGPAWVGFPARQVLIFASILELRSLIFDLRFDFQLDLLAIQEVCQDK
jgi:hypothetical protein